MKISTSETFEFPITDTTNVVALVKQCLESTQGETRFVFVTRQGFSKDEKWQVEVKSNEQKTTS